MSGSAPAGFREFVLSRGPALHRTAVLLTHDRGRAEDLVQTALAKAWRSWGRIHGEPESYVRRILVNEFATSRRRRWHGEVPTGELPEPPVPRDVDGEVAEQLSLAAALATLPPGQRAVVVLRYYHDLTEAQTAEVLGVSVGTVKSQTAKALASLRVSDRLADREAAERRPGSGTDGRQER